MFETQVQIEITARRSGLLEQGEAAMHDFDVITGPTPARPAAGSPGVPAVRLPREASSAPGDSTGEPHRARSGRGVAPAMLVEAALPD